MTETADAAAPAAPEPFKSDREANIAVAKEWLANGQSFDKVAEWLAATSPDHFASALDAAKVLE